MDYFLSKRLHNNHRPSSQNKPKKTMGSQKVQGELWGKRPNDWAAYQEKTAIPGYNYALDFLKLNQSNHLLDVGCGSGLFCKIASEKGVNVTGIDASENLITEAKKRTNSVKFLTGEMEELPFDNEIFDVVTGFNSFQYASNIKNALVEAARVLKKNGKLVTMIWGNKEDCELFGHFKAMGSLMPPPPPGSAGPFALSENKLLENNLEEAGFKILVSTDVPCICEYPNTEIAMKALLSSGPSGKVIDQVGFEKTHETALASIQDFIQDNGQVVIKNKFRVVISEK